LGPEGGKPGSPQLYHYVWEKIVDRKMGPPGQRGPVLKHT